MNFLETILDLALDIAPWLLMGLVIAGLIKAFLPQDVLQRWIGGSGFGAIGRATLIGAPLPLCSCGAIPTGLALHRAGAGKGPVAAFMISTPGIGVNSIALSYALLGPIMMLARILGAIFAALATGLLVAGQRRTAMAPTGPSACCTSKSCAGGGDAVAPDLPVSARLRAGMRYAFVDMLGDIGPWILGGLVVAALILSSLPPEVLADLLTGLPLMLLMAVIGIPIYICASAATPIAAAMLLAGVSPGAVLVFLLAGPITSLATLTIIWREMGKATLMRYGAGVIGSALAAGLFLEQFVSLSGINIAATLETSHSVVPAGLSWAALGFLLMVAARPLRRAVLRPA